MAFRGTHDKEYTALGPTSGPLLMELAEAVLATIRETSVNAVPHCDDHIESCRTLLESI